MLKSLVILSIVLFLNSCNPERNKEYLENEAYLAVFNGEFDSAIDLYTELIDLDKKDFLAYLERAKVFLEMGNLEAAVEDVKKARDLAPNNSEVLNLMAYISDLYGDEASALSYLNQSLSNLPEYYEARKQKAIILAKTEQNEDALYELNLLLDIDSTDIDALLYRAMVFGKLGKLEKAKKDLNLILLLDTINVKALSNMGLICMQENHLDSAEFYFIASLNIDPENAFSMDKISSLYIKAKEYEKAKVYLDKLLLNDDYKSRSLGKVGLIHFELSEFDAAKLKFQESIYADPTQYFGYKYLALLERQTGNDSLACEYIRSSINNGLPFEGNENISVLFEECLK